MSDTKTYVFGNDGNNGYQNGFDPNLLIGAMMGGGGFGGFGGANWLLPFLLFFLWGNNGWGNGFGGFGGNRGGNGCCNGFGGGFGFISDQLNNDAGRALIMQAIQGNDDAIGQLSTTLNCNVGELRTAINSVNTQLCNLGNTVGMSSMQVINAINSGNSSLQAQLASCCCSIEKNILESNYLTERGFNNTNQVLAKGFSDLGYASQAQTCELKGAIKDSTEAILAGQRAAEMREMQREITERDRKIAEQNNAINNYQQTQTFAAMLNNATAPIASAVNNLQSDVDGIKCRLPRTEVIPATPEYVAVNRSINVPYGPYCNYGTFNTGCCGNGSLWG